MSEDIMASILETAQKLKQSSELSEPEISKLMLLTTKVSNTFTWLKKHAEYVSVNELVDEAKGVAARLTESLGQEHRAIAESLFAEAISAMRVEPNMVSESHRDNIDKLNNMFTTMVDSQDCTMQQISRIGTLLSIKIRQLFDHECTVGERKLFKIAVNEIGDKLDVVVDSIIEAIGKEAYTTAVDKALCDAVS